MSLVADALQPAMVRGLFALRGRASIAHLPDMITGSRSGFYLDFANPNDVRIDFGDPGFVADAIGGDACRFGIAAFVSLHDLQEMTDAKSLAWAIIKLYYSAYYAGHCVLRLSGQSCSNLDGNHISRLQQIASAANPGQAFPLSRGLHHCILQASQSAFSMRKARISSDGKSRNILEDIRIISVI